MEKPEGESGKRTLAGNFECTLNLTDKRGIRMTGYMYSDDNEKVINARVDLAMRVLDRQGIRADLITKRAQIEAHTENLKRHRDHYQALVEKKATAKLTSAETKQLVDYEPQVRAAMNLIDSLQAAIDAGEKKLAE
jgi:flagellar hook protein FlgE